MILKAINQKTKEPVTLAPFKLPSSRKELAIKPTVVEARHFAATYALFRVCSMKNLHMMLPPNYRDLWKKDFQDLKTEDVNAGRAWMYEADPFAAKTEQEEAQALRTTVREERRKQNAADSSNFTGPERTHPNTAETIRRDKQRWTKAPQVDLGKRTRAIIEGLVRKGAVWNSFKVRLSEAQRVSIVDELMELGFRKNHIEEAVLECKDREETLEWLLTYVPEDDLPKWSLPERYTAGLSVAYHNLKKQASVQRLAAVGYSVDLCEQALAAHDDDETLAAEDLQSRLIAIPSASPPTNIANTQSRVWLQERDILEAIYGDRFAAISEHLYQVQFQASASSSAYTLDIRKSSNYPQTAPILAIGSAGLPAYIRLSIIGQLLHKISADFLGEAMIFNLVDWLETEISKIVEDPGNLRDLTAGAATVQDNVRNQGKSQLQIPSKPIRELAYTSNGLQNSALLERWQRHQQSPRQQKMLQSRKSIPAWEARDAIVKTVNDHQVTIISGETGSGKSTQAVQFILDDMIQRNMGAKANIICTQPRRISALGLADRVSDERCSAVGEEVGYAIRGESANKHGITKISFFTTGVLLRRMQAMGRASDHVGNSLAGVSHVFVDEVHERSLDTDLLLILLKEAITREKELKVVLMSATLDATTFEAYFASITTVGKIAIRGRTFPVDDYYLDDVLRIIGTDRKMHSQLANDESSDEQSVEIIESSLGRAIQRVGTRTNYDLIASTVRAIDLQLGQREGGILIFLPGTVEIVRTLDVISRISKVYALPLHASLTSAEQRNVFSPAPRGRRKVIAATNVAETSITIDDIVAVIDSGRVKQTSFDSESNMTKLEEVWASKAACKQRRGRAGRVQAGHCYKLYTRNAEEKMIERPEPEIRRVPLEQLCLSVLAMGISDVSAFLARALTPPENMAIESALNLLRRMGALDGDDLTALGRHMSMIPADLRCSKLMVYGATFGCLDACLAIAAILTVKSPFLSPQAKREESKTARTSFAPDQGDLLCDLRAYEDWSMRRNSSSPRDVKSWCDQNYLSSHTLRDIASNVSQYHSSLREAGFLPHSHLSENSPSLNAHNSNSALIRALVAGAFYPQLARIEFPDKKFTSSVSGAVEMDPEARAIKFFNQDNGRVFVHPGSTLFGAQAFVGGAVYMSYFGKMATSKIFVRELTREFPPLHPSFFSPSCRNPKKHQASDR